MKSEQIISLLTALLCENKEVSCGASDKQLIGEKVIVRCRDAGVHFGELINYSGREVTLKNSRRMYYWKAASGHTLSGCAIHGITDASKIAGEVKTIVLPEACEIISCENKAAKSIGEADEYNA